MLLHIFCHDIYCNEKILFYKKKKQNGSLILEILLNIKSRDLNWLNTVLHLSSCLFMIIYLHDIGFGDGDVCFGHFGED